MRQHPIGEARRLPGGFDAGDEQFRIPQRPQPPLQQVEDAVQAGRLVAVHQRHRGPAPPRLAPAEMDVGGARQQMQELLTVPADGGWRRIVPIMEPPRLRRRVRPILWLAEFSRGFRHGYFHWATGMLALLLRSY